MIIGRNNPAAVTDVPTLQWANSRTVAQMTPGEGRFHPLVGWYIEVGKDTDLDAMMPKVPGVKRIAIKHQRQGGSEIVQHWYFGEAIQFHPVTAGPVATTMQGCLRGKNAVAMAEAGIGIVWPQGDRSKLAVRGYVDVLARAGYAHLVQLSSRSRMTDVLLTALVDHVALCTKADRLVDRTRHPEQVALHEVGMVLVAGEEAEWGKGDTATVVPYRYELPATIDKDYIGAHWRKPAIDSAAHQDWDDIVVWAHAFAEPSALAVASDNPYADVL